MLSLADFAKFRSVNGLGVSVPDWDDELEWTEEARESFRKIPFFVRSQARQSIEALARERDCDTITLELVEEARQGFGK